jgi:hypothetical protein
MVITKPSIPPLSRAAQKVESGIMSGLQHPNRLFHIKPNTVVQCPLVLRGRMHIHILMTTTVCCFLDYKFRLSCL